MRLPRVSVLVALLAPACDRSATSALPSAPVLDAGRDGSDRDARSESVHTDGGALAARCPVRVHPPEDLSAGTAQRDGPAAVAWSGREWGVAWSEIAGDDPPTVFFAHVGRDGHRIGAPARVSERSYRGGTPSVVWNGESWVVVFSGGASRLEEIWLARVHARGTLMGRPQRMTARDRRDLAPSLSFSGHDLLAAWGAIIPGSDHTAIMSLRMNRWGAQLGLPLHVADRSDRLSAPLVVWNGTGWALAWLVSRHEAVAVDMARLDLRGGLHGVPSRVTLGPLGGTDLAARFGIAWDGTRYALAWDEVRDGAPHVFFEAIGDRLIHVGDPVMVSSGLDAARAPTLLAPAPDTFLAAWDVERGGDRRVQLASFDSTGHRLAEPVEVEGNDGTASSAELALAGSEVGLTTLSARGVSFHRVQLGPCGETPRPPEATSADGGHDLHR